MTHHGHDRPTAVILVGGHESDRGRALPADLPGPGVAGGPVLAVTAPGRDLERTLGQALRARPPDRTVVIVPMTLGRDPRLVSDAARTVRWAARGDAAGTIALAPPFGTADHLVGQLRAACRRLRDDGSAVLITAPEADPFDDAELHRVVALVRTHAPHAIVEVGLRRHADDLEDGLDRCRRLGADRAAVIPATFDVPDGAAGPLLSVPSIGSIVAARVATALHRLTHGDDGIAAAHDADHHHGFAHSHEAGDHGHPHGHTHHAGHPLAPAPSPGRDHRHDREHAPAPVLARPTTTPIPTPTTT